MNKNKIILVIEDEKTLSTALNNKLSKEGFNVKQAFNGEEAYAMAEKEKPDFLLVDIIMPRQDGIKTLMKIRQQDWGKEIPAIILTNLSNDYRAEEFAKIDPNVEYMIKSDTKINNVVEYINNSIVNNYE